MKSGLNMRLKLVDNVTTKLLDELLPVVAQSKECKIAVAFASTGGLSLLKSGFQQCLDRNGRIEFLVGLDLSATDPEALWTLYQMSQINPNVSFYCFNRLGVGAMYHPKLYIANLNTTAIIVVGSSNLTEGGLKENVEVNVLIEADVGEEVVSDACSIYNKLKFHPQRVKPDQEFLSLYQEMYFMRRSQERTFSSDSQFRKLKSRFTKKATSLSHPAPTYRDLFGWQRLVFERLPDGLFKPSDIYKFEDELRIYYPENKNIKAKIRQVLQQLRDMGLIKHIGKGIWIRDINVDCT